GWHVAVQCAAVDVVHRVIEDPVSYAMPNRAAPKRKPRPRATAGGKSVSRSSARAGRAPSADSPAAVAVAGDPLAEPLRALAEAAPSLLDALSEIRALGGPLAATARGLERLWDEL